MPNVFKTTLYLIDANSDMIDENWIESELNSFADTTDLMIHIAEIHKSGNLEWHDDLAINQQSATTEDYEAYFEWPDAKTYIPGIRPVNEDPDKKAFSPGEATIKTILKIVIDTRIYTNDFEAAVNDMRDFIKLGYLCNITSFETNYGGTDYKLEVFKR